MRFMGAVWMIYREDHLKMLSWRFSIKSIDALCAAAGPCSIAASKARTSHTESASLLAVCVWPHSFWEEGGWVGRWAVWECASLTSQRQDSSTIGLGVESLPRLTVSHQEDGGGPAVQRLCGMSLGINVSFSLYLGWCVDVFAAFHGPPSSPEMGISPWSLSRSGT